MKRAILVAAFIGSVGVMAGCGGDDSPSPVEEAPSPTSVSSATRTIAAPTSTPTPPAQLLADLVVDGAGNVATPIPGCARDQSEYPAVHLLVCVRNRGNADAPPFDVNATGILHFGALAAGARACLTTSPPTFGGVNIRVDDGHVVPESDELNNEVDVVVGVFTPPALCTHTQTPNGAESTPTPTPTRTHPAGAVCYEQVDCEPQLFATSLGQEACCDLARRSGGLPFSWCPAGAVSEETGRCTACLAHPCVGLPTLTPTPTPTGPAYGTTSGLCYRQAACAPRPESSEVDQQGCCNLSHDMSVFTFSWCPPDKVEDEECTGDCREPCDGAGVVTPTPVP